MCICMDCWFLILLNRLLKSIIVIYFTLQIISNLASENPLQAGFCFLTYPCHSLNTFLLSGVKCSRLISFFKLKKLIHNSTYHNIHSFKVYSSLVFNMFIEL